MSQAPRTQPLESATHSDRRPPSSPGLAGRLSDFGRRADAYFLTTGQRDAGAVELSRLRMGLALCPAAGLCILAVLPLEARIWPGPAPRINAFLALLLLLAPFVLRRTHAVSALGHVGLAVLMTHTALAVVLSGGQALAVLPSLPIMPVLGLLVAGRRGALAWSAGALGLAALGATLVASEAPVSAGFAGSSNVERYLVASLCTLGVASFVQLFEPFWNRTALEVANRAQAQLRLREAQNRRLLEHAAEGIIIVDRAAVVRFSSPAAERLLGLPPGGSRGQHLRNLMPEDTVKEGARTWERLTRTPEATARFQVTMPPSSAAQGGRIARILEVVATNQFETPVDGVVIRLNDDTERVRAEANYEALLDQSLQGIAVECEGRIVYANAALADLFGAERDELLRDITSHQMGLEHVHDDDRVLVRNRYAAAHQDPTVFRFQRADGRWKWIQARWTDATWEGRPARQIAYADITAEKERARNEEREKERLASAVAERTRELEASQIRVREQERMATVGTLAAGIAHQINNPVGAILASADFAILTADEPDGEKIRDEALEEIRKQAVRCGKIVRSVLQFSRAEPTEKWHTELSSILRTAVDATARPTEERQAVVDLRIAPDAVNATIHCNPIELEQVFVNLIQNALEMAEEAPQVEIRLRRPSPEQFEVLIADDGPGISPDQATHVFDPFFTTRLHDGGTGLGLSVARSIVVDHGGRLSLESAASFESSLSGAHFRIQLPADPSGPAREMPRDPDTR